MDMTQYLEIFIDETKEHLQGLNQSLLQLEQNPDDTTVLNEIFRVAHTLKGMAGTMGFTKMARLTHDMENVLHALRNNEISVTTKLVDVLFKCLDALENYLNSIVNTSGEGDEEYKDIIQDLNDVLHGNTGNTDAAEAPPDKAAPVVQAALPKEESIYPTANVQLDQYEQNVINKAVEMGMNAFRITVVLSKGCVLKSARSFIIFQTLERYSDIIKSIPKVEDIEDEKFDFEFTVVAVSKESSELFIKELNSIAEVEKVVISSLSACPIDTSGENNNGTSAEVNAVETAAEEELLEEKDEQKTVAASKKAVTGKTVRVDINRLDVLMNLVSELIIQKTRLEGMDGVDRSQTFNESLESLERITTDLHDAVMKVRMVPVETVFNRFPRMVRDISKDLGKEIVLNMSGEETELDRTVIDEIGDPLIHMLRNSVDHGIEPADKRKASGKPVAGHINLKAYQDGNNVIIEVSDDGQGIDTENVKKKAIEKGLISKEMANNLSQKDIIDFLFKPSFSTANKITNLSGRGVGLDVVKTKIESLNGSVEVETEKGKGSRFIIRLPLTLAIIQALLVLIGNEKYAIPISSVSQIINISPEDIKFVQKQEVILLRNMVVPIIRLDKVLGVPAEKSQEKQKQLTVVIVKKGEKLSGFLVDVLIGQQEIVIKSLGKLLQGIRCIAGATILGDGNVALILDVNSLA
ncbi:two-component system chemotaxis sensor kinase CheA [Anaerobacterium chartisolvens]|uniref:Chemotaxis protein CheA n=1 Tax=Anaerobacterium chartisolvens TaxID=1297424 RepID=A0A369B2G8_9FIRM|nr:chemotaxis protein CheA [Anaerobacterium chartisolvens]RCX15535.1 two-component system chemotaxis sensor kinase CheA [Anaerobacterium chartisolvens]